MSRLPSSVRLVAGATLLSSLAVAGPATAGSLRHAAGFAVGPEPFRIVRRPTRTFSSAPVLVRGSSRSVRGSVTTLPAILQQPAAATFDPKNGDLYVIDVEQQRCSILRIEPDGGTTLFAALPTSTANGIAYDSASNALYVTSSSSPSGYFPSVLAVTAAGRVSVLAGGSTGGQSDGTGPQASFSDPSGITVDTSDGALYLADGDRVRRVTTTGVVTTLTPPGSLGFSGFGTRIGMAYDVKSRALYAADPQLDAVLSIATPAGTVTALAGRCLYQGRPSEFTCDPLQRDGSGNDALFASPSDIASDPATGDLYVADSGNNSVRRIGLTGQTVTLAGNGLAGNVDGAGLNAEFAQPVAIAFDAKLGTVDVIDAPQYPNTPSLRSVTVGGTAPPPPHTPIALFDTAQPDSTPFAIDWRSTTPRASQLTFSERIGRAGAIATTGRSADIADPFAGTLYDCVLGADGSAWFVDANNTVVTLDHLSNGKFTQVALSGAATFTAKPDALTLGPDGNVWFALNSTNYGAAIVGYVTPAGAVTEYTPVASGLSGTPTLAFAADGTIWVAATNALVHVDASGHALQTIDYPANAVTTGPDGNVWFTQSDAVGEITSKHAILVYPIAAPNPNCNQCSRGIGAIAAGVDGALWFTEIGAIGRLTVDGLFSESQVLAARSNPGDIASGPDGNIWFADPGAQKIGRFRLH